MSDLPTSEDKVYNEVPEATSNKEDGSDVVEPDLDVEDEEENSDDDQDNDEDEDEDEDVDRYVPDDDEDIVVEDAVEEESTEPPYIPLTVDDIPALLEGLESQDSEIWNASLNKFGGIISQQEGFIAENLAAFDVPRLVKAARTTSDSTLRTTILEHVGMFTSLSEETRNALVPQIPELMWFLGDGDGLDRYNVLWMLEQLIDEEPSARELVLEGAKTLYQAVRDLGDEEVDETHLVSILEAFESSNTYGRESCKKVFIEASAFDAVLGCTQVKKIAKVRAAAQSCMVQLVPCIPELDSLLPDESDRGNAGMYLFMTSINLVKDEDEEIAKQAASFLMEDRGEELNEVVNKIVAASPDVIPALINQLGMKEPNHVGAPSEFALTRFLENEEMKKLVVDAMRSFWADEGIPAETKFKVISGLIDSFLDLRKLALENGLIDFIFRQLDDEKSASGALTIFNRLMEGEQVVGSIVLKSPAMMDKLLDMFDGPSPTNRALGASNLTRVLESYDGDSNEQRGIAAKALTQPNVYPRILAGLYSDDLSTVNASANLISEILSSEWGAQSWNYDESSGKPPPPSPIKDATITAEFAQHIVGLLKQPETAPGALNVLCQCCWGYKRGYDVTRMAFESVIPDADVFFFEALYGKFESRHAGRQRRHVAAAAFHAGGMARIESLLKKDLPTVEERRAAVEGFRVLLAADDVDLSIGRKNAQLPILLAQLFADETEESMNTACFMIRLLSDSENGFEAWTALATEETIQHLIFWLEKPPPTFERPDADKMTEKEFEKADNEYDKKVRDANTKASENLSLLSEALGYMVPLLAPFAPQLIAPLLNATNTGDQNYKLLELLVLFGNNEEILKNALVPAVKDILAKDPPPNLNTCFSWIIQGPSIASAFYQGGLLDRLEREYDLGEEGECFNSQQGLQIYEWLVKRTTDEEQQKGIQKAFFAFQPAVDQALKYLRNSDYVYDAFQAAGEIYQMAKGYPEGLAVLEKENIYPTLLELFDNKELGNPSNVGPLLGLLCHQDVGALTKLVTTHIAGLIPPPEVEEEAPAAGKKGKKGGKGGKKKKKFQPRIKRTEVLDRIASLVDTTPSARKALVDAGAIQLASSAVDEKDRDVQKTAFKVLRGFTADGGDRDAVGKFLPHLGTLLTDEEESIELIQLIAAFIPDNVQSLIDADMHRILFKAFTDFPSSIGDMALLINAVRDLGNTEAGHEPLVEVMKASFASESALEMEHNWGNAHAVRRLLVEGERSSRLVVEAGAIDYALKLLQQDDLHLLTIGGALSATLACNEYLDARPKLLELGVPKFIEAGHARCLEESKKPFESEAEGDEREGAEYLYKEQLTKYETWIEVLSRSLKVVNGEEVEGYCEDFFL